VGSRGPIWALTLNSNPGSVVEQEVVMRMDLDLRSSALVMESLVFLLSRLDLLAGNIEEVRSL